MPVEDVNEAGHLLSFICNKVHGDESNRDVSCDSLHLAVIRKSARAFFEFKRVHHASHGSWCEKVMERVKFGVCCLLVSFLFPLRLPLGPSFLPDVLLVLDLNSFFKGMCGNLLTNPGRLQTQGASHCLPQNLLVLSFHIHGAALLCQGRFHSSFECHLRGSFSNTLIPSPMWTTNGPLCVPRVVLVP